MGDDLEAKEEKKKEILDYVRSNPKANFEDTKKACRVGLYNYFPGGMREIRQILGIDFREEKRRQIVEYIKKNPAASTADVKKALGYAPEAYFDGIDEARRLAGVDYRQTVVEQKRGEILDFVKQNPRATWDEINKRLGISLVAYFPGGISEVREILKVPPVHKKYDLETKTNAFIEYLTTEKTWGEVKKEFNIGSSNAPYNKRVLEAAARRLKKTEKEIREIYEKKPRVPKTIETKTKIVKEYLFDNMTVPELVKRYGFTKDVIYHWGSELEVLERVAKLTGKTYEEVLRLKEQKRPKETEFKTRVEIVCEYLLGDAGLSKIGKRFDISTDRIQVWLRDESVIGEAARKLGRSVEEAKRLRDSKPKLKQYDADFKTKIVREYLFEGKSQEAIAQKYRINPSTISQWSFDDAVLRNVANERGAPIEDVRRAWKERTRARIDLKKKIAVSREYFFTSDAKGTIIQKFGSNPATLRSWLKNYYITRDLVAEIGLANNFSREGLKNLGMSEDKIDSFIEALLYVNLISQRDGRYYFSEKIIPREKVLRKRERKGRKIETENTAAPKPELVLGSVPQLKDAKEAKEYVKEYPAEVWAEARAVADTRVIRLQISEEYKAKAQQMWNTKKSKIIAAARGYAAKNVEWGPSADELDMLVPRYRAMLIGSPQDGERSVTHDYVLDLAGIAANKRPIGISDSGYIVFEKFMTNLLFLLKGGEGFAQLSVNINGKMLRPDFIWKVVVNEEENSIESAGEVHDFKRTVYFASDSSVPKTIEKYGRISDELYLWVERGAPEETLKYIAERVGGEQFPKSRTIAFGDKRIHFKFSDDIEAAIGGLLPRELAEKLLLDFRAIREGGVPDTLIDAVPDDYEEKVRRLGLLRSKSVEIRNFDRFPDAELPEDEVQIHNVPTPEQKHRLKTYLLTFLRRLWDFLKR